MPQHTPISPIVELEHVDARIAATTVLRDVSLQIVKGVHTGIIGANGSGKSTLLRLLSGSLWPAPGKGRRRFYFDGRTYNDAVLAKQRITLTGPELQDSYFRLGWNFSALDVVLTGLHHTEIPRRKSNANERATGFAILEKLGGSELATRSFLELSRGEQGRVLIARAIAFNPELLLLDEPFSGLDAESRGTLETTIRQAAKHTTIVISAHDADQLPSIVEKIYTVVDSTVRVYERAPGESRAGPVTINTRSQLHPEKQQPQPEIQDAPLIDIKNANIYVGNRCVLKRLNWQLIKDRHWLVTGRNGSGKSTFLRLLHGQIRPALGGSISWPGLGNPANIWQLRRLIAWVGPEFQSRYRYPTTVFGCIASGLTASIGQTRSLSDVESQECEALIDQFELRSYRDRLMASLSYGQARRALLARTLISKPAVLLLDEPWDGLDARNIELIAGVMNQQAATGVQIVCATHTGAENLVFTDHLEIRDGLIHVDEPV